MRGPSSAIPPVAGDIGRAVLRIVPGVIIAAHGWQKLTGGIDGFAGFVDSLGLPAPMALAYLVTGLELGGGVMLVLGLLTRVSGALLAIQMLATGFYVKASLLDVGFIAAQGGGAGWELDLALFAALAAATALGAGAFSADAVIARGARPSAGARPGVGVPAAG